MGRSWSRPVVIASALLAAVGGVTGGVTGTASAAPGRLASARADAAAVKAEGTYAASLPAEHSSSRLVIRGDKGVSTKEGTFGFTDLGDSGTWLESGSTIALLVTAAPTSDHLGVVFIGTVTATGVTPGRYEAPGGKYATWSATRVAAAHAKAAGARSRGAGRTSDAAAAAGSYTAHFPKGETGNLSVQNSTDSSNAGPWEFISADMFESGNWIASGKQFAMGTNSGELAGTVFIGTLTQSGIGDGTKPGVYAVVGQGVNQWSAVKNISCNSTFTVDAVHGKDTNRGTCVAPFKTLTKALSVSTSGQSIDVNAGVYDATNGETFPLTVPAGVAVIGDAGSRGTSPLTQVSGEIDLSGAGGSIEGLKVVGLVQITGANTSVLDSTVVTGGSGTFTGYCVYVLGATGVAVHNNVVNGCTNVGVLMVAQSGAQFTENSITGNGAGLEVSSGSANLGTKGHDGYNTLSCNTQADLLTQDTLLAYGNYWDHVPPTLMLGGAAAGGIDIYEGPGATVNSTFAMLTASPCA